MDSAFDPTRTDGAAHDAGGPRFDTIGRIPVTVQIVLGATTMAISDVMALRRGTMVTLDRRVGEPVDVVVNGRVVARGDLQVLDGDDARFAISITDLAGNDRDLTPPAGPRDVR